MTYAFLGLHVTGRYKGLGKALITMLRATPKVLILCVDEVLTTDREIADPLAWFPEGFSPFKSTCPCRCTIQVERRTELRDLAQSGPLTGHAGTGPAGQMRVMWVKCGPCGPDAGVTGVRRGCQLE